jgi:hypothetical protein
MHGLPPRLLQALSRVRIDSGRALGMRGVGERNSRARGEGLEVEDHRPYIPGDSLRRIDPHLFARFGKHYVRQYNVLQRMEITILVDASESMSVGLPSKFELARSIAFGLAYVAVQGSDIVHLGAWRGGGVEWERGIAGRNSLARATQRWQQIQATGIGDHAALNREVNHASNPTGFLVFIGDLWLERGAEALAALLARWRSAAVIHLLAPEEVTPAFERGRGLQVVDAETGEAVDVEFGEADLVRYRTLLDEHCDTVRQIVVRHGHRYLYSQSDADLESLFLTDFRRQGLLR